MPTNSTAVHWFAVGEQDVTLVDCYNERNL